MRTTRLINSFWELVREQSADGEILRRRIVAIGAITLGFCGFLIAIGFAGVVLAFFAVLAVAVGVATLLPLWPRLRSLGGAGIASVRERGKTTRGQLVPVARRGVSAALTISVEARTRSNALARAAAVSGSRVRQSVSQTAKATTLRFAPGTSGSDLKREAIKLNATGTQQRRDGRYDDAVECHRQALDILRDLGDRRGVALTQSNLALALSHAGDDVWAIGLFEEAAATLRELGDEEHEARIMANLGVTHRRHGRQDEGDNVLELALAKLSPGSSAYEAIEAELRRAS